jgi:ribosomal protein S18 acetylase RimI-like enzyme
VTETLKVRRATPSDIEAACVIDPFGRRAIIEARFARGAGRVGLIAGEIVAYATVTEHFFSRPFIELLVIGEKHRRRGFGRELISALLRERPGKRVFTSANASNVAMINLLANLGFVDAGTVHGLDPGDPERIFYLDVPAAV